MKINEKSSYEFFMNLKVSDFASRCDITTPDTPANTLWQELVFKTYNPILLVQDENYTYGYVAWDDPEINDDTPGTAIDCATDIPDSIIISANLGFEELIEKFKESQLFFIESKEKIEYFISRESLESYPVRATFFALALEFEEQINAILHCYGERRIGEAFKKIDAKRLRQIYAQYIKNQTPKSQGKPVAFFNSDDEIIDTELLLPNYLPLIKHTNFSDKSNLISTFPGLRASLHFDSIYECNGFFYWLKKLRNAIAHGSPIFENDKSFRKFVWNYPILLNCISSMREILLSEEAM